MKRQEDFILVMILRCKILLYLILLTSCSRSDVMGLKEITFLKNFEISSYNLGELKWKLDCRYADIDEINNTIKCSDAHILVYSKNILSSEMKSEKAYADFVKKSFYLEENAMVKSYTENIWLKTEKIFFDYHTENIFSNSDTIIYKNNIKINSKGFEAKSDLSHIKIKKHTTQFSQGL